MKSPAKSPMASPRGRPFDRHSATGVRGLAKKNGAGGKGVWGAAMDQDGVAVLDKNDPNYDSDNDLEFPLASTPPGAITLAEPQVPKVTTSPTQESAASSFDEKKKPADK